MIAIDWSVALLGNVFVFAELNTSTLLPEAQSLISAASAIALALIFRTPVELLLMWTARLTESDPYRIHKMVASYTCTVVLSCAFFVTLFFVCSTELNSCMGSRLLCDESESESERVNERELKKDSEREKERVREGEREEEDEEEEEEEGEEEEEEEAPLLHRFAFMLHALYCLLLHAAFS